MNYLGILQIGIMGWSKLLLFILLPTHSRGFMKFRGLGVNKEHLKVSKGGLKGPESLPGIYTCIGDIPWQPLGSLQLLLRIEMSVLIRHSQVQQHGLENSDSREWTSICHNSSAASPNSDESVRERIPIASNQLFKRTLDSVSHDLGLSRLHRDLFLSSWVPQLEPPCMEHLIRS